MPDRHIVCLPFGSLFAGGRGELDMGEDATLLTLNRVTQLVFARHMLEFVASGQAQVALVLDHQLTG